MHLNIPCSLCCAVCKVVYTACSMCLKIALHYVDKSLILEYALLFCHSSFTKDTSRYKDELDTMKFICKDFWSTLYKKQIDNLRTNHQVSCLFLHFFEH